MKICVLHSSYDGATSALEAIDPYANPAAFTKRHEIHTRFIHKQNANEEIDAAVAEGFDLFFNLLWGQLDDSVAGVEAIRYLESLGVPFIGTTSEILPKTKTEFFRVASASGLRVPGDKDFPKFVKPSRMWGSLFITEKSICYNQAEVDAQVAALKNHLAEHQRTNQISASVVESMEDDGIIVQEYIDGTDHSIIVIEMGDAIVPLSPTYYRYPSHLKKDQPRFLSFDIKHTKDLNEDVMDRTENPALFDKLRDLAAEAYRVNGSKGGSWGSVDFRVRSSDGEPVVIEVNFAPVLFYEQDIGFDDVVVKRTFPGGHSALIDVLIAAKLMKSLPSHEPLAAIYDKVASSNDSPLCKHGVRIEALDNILDQFNFDGTVLDLGSGTGLFGRRLHEAQDRQKKSQSTLVGIDISQEMAKKCKDIYGEVHIGLLEKLIMGLTPFDHIVSLGALQYVRPIILTAVVVRAFMLARRSVTLSIDDLPNSYIADIKTRYSVDCFNHTTEVEEFGIPLGWKLVHRDRQCRWTSPATADEVYTTIFRYEKE